MKKIFKKIITKVGLLSVFERLNFYRVKLQNRAINNTFISENPSVKLPPDFYLYETFGLDYERYYNGGKKTAEWVIDHLKKHTSLENSVILDWGCGPARILRHIPKIIKSASVYGSDYNEKYVNWSNDNISNITAKKNSLAPPLSFENNYFNVIYSISIFTHLSEKMNYKWMQELNRVSKKDAVLFITTHGEASKIRLTTEEQLIFDKGNFVEHKYKVEGNRLYSSYQPKKFFKKLCQSNGFEVLEHIERGVINGKPTQDIWLLKKIDNAVFN